MTLAVDWVVKPQHKQIYTGMKIKWLISLISIWIIDIKATAAMFFLETF